MKAAAVLPALKSAARDSQPRVRAIALAVLARIARQLEDSSAAISVLVDALSESDPIVVDAALSALAKVYWMAIPALSNYAAASTGRVRALLEALLGQTVTVVGGAVREHVDAPGLVLKPTPEPPPVPLDNVDFSAFAPSMLAPGEAFVVDLWAHLDELRKHVLDLARAARPNRELSIALKGPVKLARDTVLRVRLSIPDFGLSDEETILWTGRAGNATFRVMTPHDASLGTHLASFTIFIGPLQISRLHFELYVTSSVAPGASSTVRKISSQSRVKRAFASYASEDREEVLARVQGITKALPDLELFLDVLALRSGEKWEERIREEISTRDVFYLFWSLAASRSRWVDWEWRTALVVRGRDYIDPVPLQPASIAPPPVELADLHFNDWTLALRSRGEPGSTA